MSLKAASEGSAAAGSLGHLLSRRLAHSETMVSETRMEVLAVALGSWILLFSLQVGLPAGGASQRDCGADRGPALSLGLQPS